MANPRTGIDLAEVDRIVEALGKTPDQSIAILQAIQARFGYLPEAALRRVCDTTAITPAALTGIATFYAQFRNRPAGRHTIRVCVGTACHVRGAERTYDAFRQHLRIPDGDDTDADRLFTVGKVACLGCCMLAPAVQIDEVTYGFVVPDKVPDIIRDFIEGERSGGESAAAAAPPAGKPPAGEVRLCLCASCVAGGAAPIHAEAVRQVRALALPAAVRTVGCTGVSYQAPLVDIAMNDGRRFRYGRVRPDDVRAMLVRHFRPSGIGRRAGVAVNRLLERLLTDESWEPVTRYSVDFRGGPDALYWTPQVRLITEHAGELDPLSLADYERRNGFQALKRALRERSPEEILAAVEESGLRGRGGAGFLTARKWAMVRAAPGAVKHIICNADEGDPGAFMDRVILESFPFRVIEGMALASYAVGAHEGVLYIRAEYPLAVRRMRQALEICAANGILGDRVMGTDHALRLRVAEGAGAFVCGEETALMAAVEGRRGMPRYRPPFPSESGLWGQPTLINNVETYAAVPWILRNGAKAYAAIGTAASKGTKAFALAGKVLRGGLIEVPMGTTIREIVERIGGGIQGGRTFKAVQIGGPSGGCVPASLADTPVDYEALAAAGAIMGSGGLVVLDDADCMVDISRYFMRFTQHESCGKCTHCRIGTKRMLEILDRLCEGKGKPEDIGTLEQLAHTVSRGSLCGLGRTAPNPILSTLKHFRSEYEAHAAGRCPAHKCKALIRYRITDKCIGCTRCAQRCPADAIAMKPYEQHEIDPVKCTRCDTCRQVCPVEAVVVE